MDVKRSHGCQVYYNCKGQGHFAKDCTQAWAGHAQQIHYMLSKLEEEKLKLKGF